MLTIDQLRQLPNFAAFDRLFKEARDRYFAGIFYPWQWLKAQAIQESLLDPNARNARSGAVGLMQLMPSTDRWVDDDLDATDPEGNIDNGAAVMAFLMGIGVSVRLRNGGTKALGHYRGFMDVDDPVERWKFALAGYNAGWGWIGGKAPSGKLPARAQAFKAGERDTEWARVATYLANLTGQANAHETLNYVANIVAYAGILVAEERRP
jgi:soluble lytic murein transglycosylase-like protein